MSVDWLRTLPRHAVDPRLIEWLTHPGSLTAKLRAASPQFRVRVLRQTQAQPHSDERRLLGLKAHQHAWVREVTLCAGDLPLVFAHSVLPLQNVRGAWHLFAGLGARPLGEVLFTDPGIDRSPLGFSRIDKRHPLYSKAVAANAQSVSSPTLNALHQGQDLGAKQQPSSFWARRSLFAKSQRALLVTEVFLPSILYL